MSNSATPARARLDAWREQGADRFDPLRFHVMEALERRAADHGGETRRRLDERLSTLLDAYEVDLGRVSPRAPDIGRPAENATMAQGLLSALLDHAAARPTAMAAP